MEEAVTVHARDADIDIVSRAVQSAQATYTDISGRSVKVSIEGTLPKDWLVTL